MKMHINNLHSKTCSSKRLFDIFFAAFGLVMSAPFFPLIALAIKLDSKGSIFYQQTRVGIARETYTELFQIYKFRTMVSDAESHSGAVWAQKNDPRITRVGRFLRATRLDELPQFINVLKGEMSLIGPRPERPAFYGKLEEEIPFFAERTYGVLPGVSGLAQIECGYDTSIEGVRSKLELDLSYGMQLGDTRSWLKLDLEIVVRTIYTMLSRKGQ